MKVNDFDTSVNFGYNQQLNKELIKSKPVISQVKIKANEKNEKISKFSFLDEEGELNE